MKISKEPSCENCHYFKSAQTLKYSFSSLFKSAVFAVEVGDETLQKGKVKEKKVKRFKRPLTSCLTVETLRNPKLSTLSAEAPVVVAK